MKYQNIDAKLIEQGARELMKSIINESEDILRKNKEYGRLIFRDRYGAAKRLFSGIINTDEFDEHYNKIMEKRK